MSAPAPVIGITAALERARWTVWDVEANVSQRVYSLGVAEAGAVPVLLPADERVADEPARLLDLLDGLVLTGGADIDPACYGQEPGEWTAGYNAQRDRYELALCRGALARGMPLLGICRGMQLLNVACGGTLRQHVREPQRHLHTPGMYADHEVELEPGSLSARAVGCERLAVRSHHHQGVGELGEGLAVRGRSVPDGEPEAVERTDGGWALGVLWHAEEERRSPVLAALASAARREGVAA